MECPQCSHSPPTSHPITVDAESYACVQAADWPGAYDGISDATVRTTGGPKDTVGIRLEIDQSAYETENHYKHRKQHTGTPNFVVEDVEAGVVDVWFVDTGTMITAWRCTECECVWDDELGVLEEELSA
jgi:hypothetical protein